jgi:hypothetical protein
MAKRIKCRAVTMYLDPKYEDKLTFLRGTIGITQYFSKCLDRLTIDAKTYEAICMIRDWNATHKASELITK